MKKLKEMKFGLAFFLIICSVLLFASFTSAGLGDWLKSLTGKATSQQVGLNISVGNNAPNISLIVVNTSYNVNEDNTLVILVNFTAFDADGSGNLNTTSGTINFTRGSEVTRQNASCVQTSTFGTSYANYSCIVQMWYYDGAGAWNIGAGVKDANGSVGTNATSTFTLNELAALKSSPTLLAFSANPGATNATASNNPLLLNNTGNKNIAANNIQINATNLKGETDALKAIYAANISVANNTGGSPPLDCNGTTMTLSVFANVTNSILPKGDHSANDGSTGQEQLYFCVKKLGSELSSQFYSTSSMGAWTVNIA